MTDTAKSRRFLIVICVVASGCGGEPGRVPVAGRVFVDGRPLSEGAITFFCPMTKLAVAAPVKDGLYALRAGDGPSPGAQVVRILGFRPVVRRPGASAGRSAGLRPVAVIEAAATAPAPPEQFLPARFNTRSELTADLAAGENDHIDFRLNLSP